MAWSGAKVYAGKHIGCGCPRKRSPMLPKLMLHRDNFQSAPVGVTSLPQALGGGQDFFSSMGTLRPRETRNLSHVAGIIS